MKYSLFTLLILSIFAFSSCEDVIDVKLPEENLNLLGVEARITTIDQPTVFLYKTAVYFSFASLHKIILPYRGK